MRTLEELRSAHYSSLTRAEWEFLQDEGIVNWYWPSGDKVLHFLIEGKGIFKWMAPMFRRSNACVHDFTYWQGGDEKRRKECDDGFMLRLVQDALDASIWTRGYYLILAVVFYASVRILGKRHFNYR